MLTFNHTSGRFGALASLRALSRTRGAVAGGGLGHGDLQLNKLNGNTPSFSGGGLRSLSMSVS